MKVSVVVPVYNPGPYFRPCLDSLLGQTMSPRDHELIFVDDASTDGTGELLDEVAAEHPQVRVIHRETGSGWSGTPRNDGIDAARGEYVQLVDHDDMLTPRALELLYGFARRNGSDVVIGRVEGSRRSPVALFTRTRDHLVFPSSAGGGTGRDGIIVSLTPHKMFRRAFLDEHGLRFATDKRRLEDHLFMVQAYFAASSIGVYADELCYIHTARDDGGNAAGSAASPELYFDSLRDVLDVVDQNVPPGPGRDRLYRRWMNGEVLRRVRGPRLLSYDDEYRERLVEVTSKLVQERFAPTVDDLLTPDARGVAALLRSGDLAGLLEQARAEADVRVRARLVGVRYIDGRLQMTVVAGLVSRSLGRPLHLGPDDPLAPAEVPAALTEPAPATRQPVTGRAWGQLSLRFHQREAAAIRQQGGRTRAVWRPSAQDEQKAIPRLRLRAHVRPPAPVAGTEDGLTHWDVKVQLQVYGRRMRTAVHVGPDVDLAAGLGTAERPAVTLRRGRNGRLVMAVRRERVGGAARRAAGRMTVVPRAARATLHRAVRSLRRRAGRPGAASRG